MAGWDCLSLNLSNIHMEGGNQGDKRSSMVEEEIGIFKYYSSQENCREKVHVASLLRLITSSGSRHC